MMIHEKYYYFLRLLKFAEMVFRLSPFSQREMAAFKAQFRKLQTRQLSLAAPRLNAAQYKQEPWEQIYTAHEIGKPVSSFHNYSLL